MQPALPLGLPETEKQAEKLQRDYAPLVIAGDRFDNIKLVAGVDVAYAIDSDEVYGGIVVLEYDPISPPRIVEEVVTSCKVDFPYIPGLFSFRELPPLIDAMAGLSAMPDLIICDGQGIAHPRRFGLASHLGLLFDVPTIGCGKTRLIGEHDTPSEARGSSTLLIDNGETIGACLRTQNSVNPVYVSVGHRVSLQTACDWVLKMSPNYRLPETTRMADQAVKKAMSGR